MKKIYHLKTCDTCRRIIKSLKLDSFEYHEIKTNPITVSQLEQMGKLSGSFESLFSRRAKKYKQMDLKNQDLSEKDYRQLILDEYTFLKRPVVIIDNEIFIGNSPKVLEKLANTLNK
jgi:arsenate reductase